MTLSLTCSCGARLEIDDKFAGQTLRCPDCEQSLQAPFLGRLPLRTSGFAVASFVLALVGAFTVVGTLLAIVLGLIALVDIKRHRDRVAGRSYAIAGIALGTVLTGLSLFAYLSFELFGLDGLIREPKWAGKLDYSGPLEIIRSKEGFAITRPSEKWGLYNDPDFRFANWVQLDLNLLLVNVAEDGYLVCWPVVVDNHLSLERCREKALEYFREGDLTKGPSKSTVNLRSTHLEVRRTKPLPTVNDTEAIEMLVDKSVGGQRRTYLVRVLKKQGDDQMYLVAGGTSSRRFDRLEAQLRKGLDSFRLLDRLNDRNWP
jgi:hypothetical protein